MHNHLQLFLVVVVLFPSIAKSHYQFRKQCAYQPGFDKSAVSLVVEPRLAEMWFGVQIQQLTFISKKLIRRSWRPRDQAHGPGKWVRRVRGGGGGGSKVSLNCLKDLQSLQTNNLYIFEIVLTQLTYILSIQLVLYVPLNIKKYRQ